MRNVAAWSVQAIAVWGLLVASAQGARADTITLAYALVDPVPRGFQFGRAIAGIGDNLLAGDVGDTSAGEAAGAAYMFDGTTGTLQQTFFSPTPSANDQFGWSVGSLGNKVLVGARLEATSVQDGGAAYVFDATTGDLLFTLSSPAPSADQQFGWSLSAVGENILVGAIRDGEAYLFDGSDGELLQTFVSPSPTPGANFGVAVAGLGDSAVVGARGDDTAGVDAGAVYVYDATTGALSRVLVGPNPIGASFGSSVAAVGGDILVGAPWDNTAAPVAGAAYLFDGPTGSLLRTFVSPNAMTLENFGASVIGFGDLVVIGAPGAAGTSGAAYVFDRDSGALVQTLYAPSPAPNALFGKSLAAFGDFFAVGAFGVDDDAGAVYVYRDSLTDQHPIPEPSTLLLFALGSTAVLWIRRKRGDR